mgnify:CR=1 FL=1
MEPAAGAPTVLVVDDEPHALKTVGMALRALGYAVDGFDHPQDAVEAVSDRPANHYDLALVDLKMRPLTGLEVLDRVREQAPTTPVVIITAHGTVESAVEAIKRGAFHYLAKPFELDELRLLAERAIEHGRRRPEAGQKVRATRGGGDSGTTILTRDSAFRETLDLAARVAESSLSILIQGESGTGKELVAALVHERSARAKGPLVKVNCAALSESLLESELFGHAKGSFTGALKDRQGRFEVADGGTLVLDEIGEIPTAVQAKLLRVLQEKTFERVGESQPRKVDVRIVAATNRNLEAARREGTFREDLYYRLNGVRLRLPPLRERRDDVPLLVTHFVARAAERYGEPAPAVGAEAMRALRAYDWPGNVRELENVVERAVLLARGGACEVRHLPEELREAPESPDVLLSLDEVERRHIARVLALSDGYEEAAHTLGIDTATLWRKRKRYGLG